MSGFEDRINENSTEFEKEFLKNHDGNLWTSTQQEIDSMETGSYEQIEVVK